MMIPTYQPIHPNRINICWIGKEIPSLILILIKVNIIQGKKLGIAYLHFAGLLYVVIEYATNYYYLFTILLII